LKKTTTKTMCGGFDMTKENAPMTHGIHIHNYGDMRDSCESLGSHFNPDDTALKKTTTKTMCFPTQFN
jgi:Cu/Zn superoxide dismutase